MRSTEIRWSSLDPPEPDPRCPETLPPGTSLGSAKKLDFRLAEPEEIRRCRGNRSVDGEDRDLELVARGDGAAEHQATGHVEALDRPGAGSSGGARHLAVDPDFGIVVDVHPQNGHRAGSVEPLGISRDR